MTDTVLYTNPLSANSHRVKLFLSLLGMYHTEVEVDLRTGEHRGGAFTTLNAWQAIPVLIDSGRTFNESYAILMYLARAYADEGGDRWWPSDAAEQAQVARWLFYTANELHNGIGLARNEFGFGIPSGGSYAHGRALRALDRLNTHLRDRYWLELDRPTIADVTVYPFVAVAPEAGLDTAPYGHIAAWVDRISQLPGFVAMPRLLPEKVVQP